MLFELVYKANVMHRSSKKFSCFLSWCAVLSEVLCVFYALWDGMLTEDSGG